MVILHVENEYVNDPQNFSLDFFGDFCFKFER